jgi:hypothetical protein
MFHREVFAIRRSNPAIGRIETKRRAAGRAAFCVGDALAPGRTPGRTDTSIANEM